MGRRPNFIVIGAMRAGTTALFEYLRQHPQIFMAQMKEVNFFWSRWHKGIDWYERLFADAGDALVAGEASPEYTMFPVRRGVAERIAKVVPDARLVYVMREPIERMRSIYIWRLAAGEERRTMADAFVLDPTYVWQSSYAMQIEEYLRFFDSSQILLLLSEDLRDRRAETLRRVLEFVGADPAWEPPNLEAEYNSPRPVKPRRAFRMLGDAIIRAQTLAGIEYRPARFPDRFRPYISEAIRPSETLLDDDLRETMAEVLRSDLDRLVGLMPPGFDAWGLV